METTYQLENQAPQMEEPKASYLDSTLPKVKVKSLSRVQTLHEPMDCSLPGPSAHGIFQARVLEWGAIAFSKPR